MAFMLQYAPLSCLLTKLKMPSDDLQVYNFLSLFCGFKPLAVRWIMVIKPHISRIYVKYTIEWEIEVVGHMAIILLYKRMLYGKVTNTTQKVKKKINP